MKSTAWPIAVLVMLILPGCFPEEIVDVSPDGQTILFSQLENEGALFLLPIDGKEAKLLTNKMGAWCPRFSPDGRFCVFEGLAEDEQQLVLYDLERNSSKVLRSWKKPEEGDVYLIYPYWKPDGKEIAYVSWETGASDLITKLYIISPETLEERLVEETVSLYCSWSPDGEQLAFFRFETTTDWHSESFGANLASLMILGEGKKQARAVAGMMNHPFAQVDWLSNDRILFTAPKLTLPKAFLNEDDLRQIAHVYDLTTETVAPIDRIGETVWGNSIFSCLRLSPDRKRLLYSTFNPGLEDTTSGGSGRTTLWCYDFAARSHSKRKIAESVWDKVYPFWVTNNKVGYFSNKGRTIILAELDDDEEVVSESELNLEELLAPLIGEKEAEAKEEVQPKEE